MSFKCFGLKQSKFLPIFVLISILFWCIALILQEKVNQTLILYYDNSTEDDALGSEKKKKLEERFKSRRQRIIETCQRFGIADKNVKFSNNSVQRQWQQFSVRRARLLNKDPPIMMDKTHHGLLYCWTRKAASTSWQMLFYRLAGMEVSPKLAHKGVSEFRPKDYARLNKLMESNKGDIGHLKFFFARHPFDRLVSVYVQKFELGYTDDYIYEAYAPRIVAFDLTSGFRLRPRIFIDRVSGLKRRGFWLPKARPTFKQFVSFILEGEVGSMDDHWRPQWLHCNLCRWKFQISGHVETSVEDSEYIIRMANLTNIPHLPWNNNSKQRVHGRQRSKLGTAAYLSQLDTDQIEALVLLYQMDFEIFGYSPNVFFD